MQISTHVSLADVEKSNTAIRKGIKNTLPPEYLENAKHVAKLYDQIYEHFAGDVYINSFFRSEKLNKVIGGSSTSQHCFAQAIDIEGKNGVTNKEVLDYARTLDFDQVISEFQDAKGEPQWVHISRKLQGNRGQVLKAVKKSGKTTYVKF